MNKKITTYLLKLIRTKKRIAKCKIDDKYLVTDGYVAFIIPENEIEVNVNLIEDTSNLQEMIESLKDVNYKEGKIKYYIKNGIGLCGKIENDKKYSFINSEYLRYFKDYTIEIKGTLDPIKVLNYKNELIGIIMPVRMSEEEKQ
ncbi:MAG: hypothetical protein [Bacteriophage sp.]|nr:MAG: hypothetical protein [Bacteriophage sp.]UWG92212.1 MAG: hypothetical protein [Bacteriophage sp.]